MERVNIQKPSYSPISFTLQRLSHQHSTPKTDEKPSELSQEQKITPSGFNLANIAVSHPTNSHPRANIVQRMPKSNSSELSKDSEDKQQQIQTKLMMSGVGEGNQSRNNTLGSTMIPNQPSITSGSPQIQKQDPVSVASLGVAIFAEGRTLSTSGSLYHSANTPSYMHERTPETATWESVVTILHIRAYHPRLGPGNNQHFYYRLSYQRNGYDIRNAQVDILRDQSSGMYMSTFGSTWSGQTHSRPTETVTQIVFNISGEWNPVGRGHVSWWGQLIISATKGGRSYQSLTIGSEQNWVRNAT